MSVTVFTGCSFTAGSGFDLEQNDPLLWANIFHSTNQYLQNTTSVNLGENGGSNEDIFKTSIGALFGYCPKYMFVEYTSYPRYSVLLGLETYNTVQKFTPNGPCMDRKLHDVNYSSGYLENVRDRFFSLHHPHQGILNIVKYTNALINIAKTTGTKIFFINGLCSWDNKYFVVLNNVLPKNYTPYTQKLLNCNTRDDDEVFQIYSKMHSEYQKAGSIQEHCWLNLYNSMRAQKIDENNDGHPGIASNQNYANTFNQQLNRLLAS